MRAIILCACAALWLSAVGCSWWGRRPAGADAANASANTNANTNASAAATHDAAAPPAPAGEELPPLPPGSDARAHFERGVHEYRQDRDEAAAQSFQEAVRLDPGFAEAHYRLGLALSATGRDEEAEKAFGEAAEAFEKLVKKDAKDVTAQFFLGLSYGKLGEYEKAVKAFKEAVKDAPDDDDDLYYELGLAQYKLAEYAESVRALEKALAINPDNFPAAELLERAKSGRERREAFIKRQEQLRKQQGRGNSNANPNANANSANRNAAPAPTAPPGDARPRRVEPPNPN